MTAFEPKDLISLIQPLAWPITTLVGLFYFRRPLHKLIEELPCRASKISILDFSIEHQLGMAEQVRHAVNKANKRLYGKRAALHFRDSSPQKDKEEKIAVCE